MRIELYEQMKANQAAAAAKRLDDNTRRAAAAADVANAKKQYDDLLEQAAAGGASDELNAAISRAHGAVLVAEKRQQKLLAQPGDNSLSQDFNGATSRVSSEIRRQIADGVLLAELQPMLDELTAIRAQYLEKVRDVLHAREQINRELKDIQNDMKRMEQQATGNSHDFGFMGMAQLDLDALRSWVWLWMYDDLGETMRRLEVEAYEAANGPIHKGVGVIVRDRIELPDEQQPKPYGWKAPVQYQSQMLGAAAE